MAVNLAIFASGSGSNAENLFLNYQNKSDLKVSAIFCNNSKAFVIDRAKKLEIPYFVFSREEFQSDDFLHRLKKLEINFIVLAGFLWKIPEFLIKAYPDRIINIHPALLPKYGGKGMYGKKVHEAVVANGDKVSGITIHLVNENYDEGRILHQETCRVTPSDTPDSLAQKVHELEYRYFPQVVADYIRKTA